MNFKNKLALLIVIIAFYQIAIFIYYLLKAIYKHFLVRELNLSKRYGNGSYVIITGPSSGQGKHFAYEFAKRGFNLILIGSERTKKVTADLQNKYNNTYRPFYHRYLRILNMFQLFFLVIHEKMNFLLYSNNFLEDAIYENN